MLKLETASGLCDVPELAVRGPLVFEMWLCGILKFDQPGGREARRGASPRSLSSALLRACSPMRPIFLSEAFYSSVINLTRTNIMQENRYADRDSGF